MKKGIILLLTFCGAVIFSANSCSHKASLGLWRVDKCLGIFDFASLTSLIGQQRARSNPGCHRQRASFAAQRIMWEQVELRSDAKVLEKKMIRLKKAQLQAVSYDVLGLVFARVLVSVRSWVAKAWGTRLGQIQLDLREVPYLVWSVDKEACQAVLYCSVHTYIRTYVHTWSD